jgi:hypothetical protein
MMLKEHKPSIDQVIMKYEGQKSLTLLEGVRKSVGASMFPSFEVEPQSSKPSWAATRLQRTDFYFYCLLTTCTTNEELHANYSATLATAVIELMSNPSHLQFDIPGESKVWLNNEVEQSRVMDSFVENISYKSMKAGTMRVAEFTWRVTVNEPFTTDFFDKSMPPNEPLEVQAPVIVHPE